MSDKNTEERKNATYIRSKEDLIEQMNSIHQMLDNTENEWEDRAKAIEKLQNICYGNATKENNLYITFLEKLNEQKTPLSKTLEDLRSGIVKVICQTLSCLAERLRGDFEPMAVFLFPYLFKIAGKTTQIFTISADAALKSIARSIQWSKTLTNVQSHYKGNKNNAIRLKCMEIIDFMLQDKLQNHQINQSENTELIFQLIKSGLSDSSGPVREISKTCFASLDMASSECSRNLYKTLDSTSQKRLASIMKSSNESSENQHPNKIQSVNNITSSSTLKTSLPTNEEPLRSKLNVNTNNKPKISLRDMIKRDKEKKQEVVTSEKENFGRVEVVLPPTPVRKDESIQLFVPTKINTETKKTALPLRVENKNGFVDHESISTYKSEMAHALKVVSSDSWSTRLESFDTIFKLLNIDEGMSVAKNQEFNEKIFKNSIDHITDSNNQVSLSALKVLGRFLDSSLSSFVPMYATGPLYLTDIFTKLLKRVEDKENFSMISTKILNRLSSILPSSDIFPVITKIVETSKKSAQVYTALQYLCSMIPKDKFHYFKIERNIRAFVKVSIMICKNFYERNIFEASISSLYEIYSKYNSNFVNTVQQMEEVHLVVELMKVIEPTIGEVLIPTITSQQMNNSSDFHDESSNWLMSPIKLTPSKINKLSFDNDTNPFSLETVETVQTPQKQEISSPSNERTPNTERPPSQVPIKSESPIQQEITIQQRNSQEQVQMISVSTSTEQVSSIIPVSQEEQKKQENDIPQEVSDVIIQPETIQIDSVSTENQQNDKSEQTTEIVNICTPKEEEIKIEESIQKEVPKEEISQERVVQEEIVLATSTPVFARKEEKTEVNEVQQTKPQSPSLNVSPTTEVKQTPVKPSNLQLVPSTSFNIVNNNKNENVQKDETPMKEVIVPFEEIEFPILKFSFSTSSLHNVSVSFCKQQSQEDPSMLELINKYFPKDSQTINPKASKKILLETLFKRLGDESPKSRKISFMIFQLVLKDPQVIDIFQEFLPSMLESLSTYHKSYLTYEQGKILELICKSTSDLPSLLKMCQIFMFERKKTHECFLFLTSKIFDLGEISSDRKFFDLLISIGESSPVLRNRRISIDCITKIIEKDNENMRNLKQHTQNIINNLQKF